MARQPTLLRTVTYDLPPVYFAMVMATGIISISADMQGLTLLARLLFYLNCVLYVVLWLLQGLRLCWYPRRFFADMFDHACGPGYFSWVASSAVLGSQFVVLEHAYAAALSLWVLSGALWLGLTYTIFTVLAVKKHKPPLQEGINGGWLLAVVATQAVAMLSAHTAAAWPQPYRLELNFLALSMWLWGGMLYIWMISLIFYRYYFFSFSPGDLAPPFWISMGAMAISTLAGSLLIANTPGAPYLESLLPFLKGFTVFYWATGTWWIPMLFLLGLWRHVIKRFPLKYDPQYWGAVFPLGMYSAATYQMTQAMGFDFLRVIPGIFLYLSLLAWAVTFFGFLHSAARRVRSYSHRAA